jgi:hypothetical protein
MTTHTTPSRLAVASSGRALLWLAALVGLLSCGGGGGAGADREPRPEGVYSGFEPKTPGLTLEQALNWEYQSAGGDGSGTGGVGAGADGDGGVGAGGDFGQFRNARLIVRYPDGTLVGGGEARTDANTGMVTIVPRRDYRGPLYLELHGGGGASYYEEGKDAFVDFPAGVVIRAIVPAIDRNIGITPFSEAAYRLLTEGSTAERAANTASPTAAEIAAANARVLGILNLHVPERLRVDDVARLPFIKSPSIGASIGIDPRGRYGLVNGAFSKQAAMFNPERQRPTLDAMAQLSADLLDGVFDGMNGSVGTGPAEARTYDAHTFTGELSSALAEQAYRFGTDESRLSLPRVLNFGHARYDGYLFDTALTARGEAIDTVVGWVGDNPLGRTVGQSFNKLPSEARVFGALGNFGHGSSYYRANTVNSRLKAYVLGDNTNGELGTGDTASTGGQPREIGLPGVPTHVAGGFAHTLARMADGAVYAWGDNAFGQLGTAGGNSALPVRVSLPREAIAVAATDKASYALLDDGSLYAWGSSAGFGLLGDGDKNSASATPKPVTTIDGVVQIAARDNDVVVLRRDGSVWHWGSFPADLTAFTPGAADAPYAGGTPQPKQVVGLPAGMAVRKILTEQGLFAALLANGAVYTWGVYYDITADAVMRDLDARRVLGLPPLRDMMPGGFIGYGARPFDRLTAMGIDYAGGMWKVRGRVAEEYDPANPAQQRRPRGQAPRADCETCHTALSGWPLAPDAPTTSDACLPSATYHGGGGNDPLLIHADTACEKCHNPERTTPQFPRGWLTCVKNGNLSPRSSPVPPPAVPNACTIPTPHPFTPPGTVCASCHNSVIARPMNHPAINCAQPPGDVLPALRTVATISTALDDAGANIPAGATTRDTTPTLRGATSAALGTGQVVRVLRNGNAVGSAQVNGTDWSFTDTGVGNGLQRYVARVESGDQFGPSSDSYAFSVDTGNPVQSTTVVVIDDTTNTALANPGFTSDTTPTISGTLSAPLGSGERVRLLRDGAVLADLGASGTAWRHTEPQPLAAAGYTYTARVVDAAGKLGPLSGETRVTVVRDLPGVRISGAVNDNNTRIPEGGYTTDNSPTLQGTLDAALSAGQVLRVLRDGVAFSGTAAVSGTSWSFTDPGAADGAHTYTARTEQGTVVGSVSLGYAFTIDTQPPKQVANVTQIADDVKGDLDDGASTSDTTPRISGTLSAALAADEAVRLLRNGEVVATFDAKDTAWFYTEQANLTAGKYTYAARVVDAAGLQSATAGSTRTVVIDPSYPLADAATTLESINNVAPVAGAVPANADTTPTLFGRIQRTLTPSEVVRVYRNGQGVGTANIDGLVWAYTSATLPEGTYTFYARIELATNANVYGRPSESVRDPIDVPPQTGVRISAISNVVPFSPVKGAVPADENIVGRTDDPTPTVTLQLSAALDKGESVEVRRNDKPIAPRFESCGTNCLRFVDDPGVKIPQPDAEPNTTLPLANVYTAHVVDAGGNRGPQGSLRADFDYFDCDQQRANLGRGGSHSPVSAATDPKGSCADCHRTSPATKPGEATKPGVFVAVLVREAKAAYWCRRP